MAIYFTLAIECYNKDVLSGVERFLDDFIVRLPTLDLRFVVVEKFYRSGFWYIHADPEDCNSMRRLFDFKNSDLSHIVDLFYKSVSKINGIRRAMCGYEAQDYFVDGYNNPVLNDFSGLDLLFDASLSSEYKKCTSYGKYVRNQPVIYS